VPEFSAIFNVGSTTWNQENAYVMVSTDNATWSGAPLVWDSGNKGMVFVSSGSRCQDIPYGTLGNNGVKYADLANDTSYYWRISFYANTSDNPQWSGWKYGHFRTGPNLGTQYIWFQPSGTNVGAAGSFPFSSKGNYCRGLDNLNAIIQHVANDNNTDTGGGGETDQWSLVSKMAKIVIVLDCGTYYFMFYSKVNTYQQQLLIDGRFITNSTYFITIDNSDWSRPVISPGASTHGVVINAPYTKVKRLSATGSTNGGYAGYYIAGDNSDYVTLDNCFAYNNYYGICVTSTASGVYPDYDNIFNCLAFNNLQYGIFVYGQARNTTVEQCEAFDNQAAKTQTYGIYASANAILFSAAYHLENCTIKNNTVRDNKSGGIEVSGYSSAPNGWAKNCKVIGNRIYNNTSFGMYVGNYTGSTFENSLEVKNNVIYSDGSNQDIGINVYAYSNYGKYFNNTFYNHDNCAIYVISGSVGNHFNSNIICVQNSTISYGIYCEANSALVYSNYNDIYRLGANGYVGYWNSANRQLLTDWQSASANDSNSISQDPLFYNAGANDYHLQSSKANGTYTNGGTWVTCGSYSPCIDAGDPNASAASEPAPNGGRINQGAYGGTAYASLSLGSAPTVTNAHVQSISSHASDDGFAISGGITAGTVNVYVDYNSISCPGGDPDNTAFILTITGGSGSGTLWDNTDTTTPAVQNFTGLTLTGATKLTGRVKHWVKTGANNISDSVEYYVKPYTPNAPAVAQVPGSGTSLTVNPSPNGAEDSTVLYAIWCNTLSKWVASDNTPTAADESTAAWRTDANWGTCYVGGLIPSTNYAFQVKSRNYYGTTTYSTLSGSGNATTDAVAGGPRTLYCRVSGGSNTYPYDTYAKAFNGFAEFSPKIAEVNAGYPTGSNYDVVAAQNQITVLLDGVANYTETLLLCATFITNATYYMTITNIPGQAPNIAPSSINGIVINAKYTHVTNIYVSDAYPYAINIDGADNCVFVNCQGAYAQWGWRLVNSDYTYLSGCVANGSNLGFNIRDNCDYTTLENCTVYYNTGAGTGGIYCGVNTEVGTTIRNCIIYSNDQYGIYVRGTIGAAAPYVITNNIFFDNSGSYQKYGIYVSDANSDRVWIKNNTFYGHTVAAIYFIDGSQTNFCCNNIIAIPNSATAYGIYLAGATANFFTGCNYNCFYRLPDGNGVGNVGYFNSVAQQTRATWSGATGYDANSFEGRDPYFANIAAGSEDFHLKSTAGRWTGAAWTNDTVTSPCIDGGDPNAAYSNEPAANGARINMGAYGNTAYASKSPTPAPPLAPLCEGGVSSTTLTVFDCQPEFSAIVSHYCPVIIATDAQIQVGTDNSTWTMWDSGTYNITDIYSGSRCQDVQYGASGAPVNLAVNTTYYWRIRFNFTYSGWGAYAYGRFMTGDEFGHYRIYMNPAGGNQWPYGSTADARITVATLSDIMAALNGDNNNNNAIVNHPSNYDLVTKKYRFTIVFANGTYSGNTLSIATNFNTSKIYYILLDAAGGATPLISVSGSPNIDAVDILACNTTIRGLSTTGATSSGYSGIFTGLPNANLTYGQNISVINCICYGNYYGYLADFATNCNVISSTFYNNTGYGIFIYRNTAGALVDNCASYGNSEGIHVGPNGGVYNDLNGITIRNNRIYNNAASGIKLMNFSTNYFMVKNNIIYTNNNTQPWGFSNIAGLPNIYIVNNTFYNHSEYAIRFGMSGFLSSYEHYNSNIICIPDNATSFGFVGYSTSTATDYSNYNCLFRMGAGGGYVGKFNDTPYQTLSAWNSGTGFDVDSISTDPLLASTTPGSEDFHLKSEAGRWNGAGWTNDSVTSPCIDAGDPNAAYSNEPAPNGSRINQGAYGNTTQASKTVVDTTPPVVTVPHIQSAATHAANASDGLAPNGGIAAGTTSLYVDYDTITEARPDCTSFTLTITGGAGSGTNTNTSDTTTLSPYSYTVSGIDGGTKMSCKVGHKDKNGNYGEAASPSEYYVKPYAPQAPSVAAIGGNYSALTVNVNPNGSENATHVEYQIYCTNASNYVQTDNTLGATPAWRTDGGWSTCTVGGLTSGLTYTFQVRSRNYYGNNVYSDWSATASAMVNIGLPMAGIYTIKASGGDYTTVQAALTDASLRGVGGSVTFELYLNSSETVVINDIPGTSAANTVTLKTGPGEPYRRSISSTTGSVLTCYADYVIFDNLEIGPAKTDESTVTTYHGILISTGATYNQVKNCYLKNESVCLNSSTCSNNEIYLNQFEGAAQTYVNNGIFVNNSPNNKIYRNSIRNYRSTGGNWDAGILIQGDSADGNIIYNNMITNNNTDSPSGAIGIMLYAGPDGTQIFFNTIVMKNGNCIFQDTGVTPATMMNSNILYVTGAFSQYVYGYCIKWSMYAGSLLTSNYNDLYSDTGSSYVVYDGWNTVEYDWAGWQGIGKDTNGINGNPSIVSWTACVPDLNNNSPCRNAGVVVSGYTTDYYGTTRDASPDMGAYELAPLPNAAPVALHCEGGLSSSTLTIFDCKPEFSAVTNGGAATHVEIEVSSDNGNWASPLWDSGKYDIADIGNATRCPDVEYGTNSSYTNLSVNATYYWRIIFFNGADNSGWTYARFMTGDEFGHYRIYCRPSGGGNNWPYGHQSDSCNGVAALSDIIAALNGDNNNNVSGPGISNYNLVNRTNRFTVLLDNGSYADSLTLSNGFVDNTSAAYYVAMMNKPGAVPEFYNASGSNVDIRVSYTRLSGISSSYNAGGGRTGVGFYFASLGASTLQSISMQYCNSYANDYCGIRIDGAADNISIAHSRINSNASHGIIFWSSDVSKSIGQIDIYNCSVYSNAGKGIYLIGTVNIDNVTIRTNNIYSNACGIRFFDFGGAGFVRNCRIFELNRIYNNTACGIDVFSGVDNSGNFPLQIVNNVIYASGGTQAVGIAVSGACDYVRIKNNTFYNNMTGLSFEASSIQNHCNSNIICIRNDSSAYGFNCADTTPFAVCDYNDIFNIGAGKAGYWNGANASDLGAWQTASGKDANSISSDPLFVDAAGYDYHLKSQAGHWTGSGWANDSDTSPCIDAGNPADSYSNEPIPNGGRINQGAYGNTAQASKTPPGAPQTPHCEGGVSSTTLTIFDCQPEFSAVVNETGGANATHVRILVSLSNTSWTGGDLMWDSGVYDIVDAANASRCVDIQYGVSGSPVNLAVNTTYYWKIKFFFGASDAYGSRWAYGRFLTGDEFGHYRVYYAPSGGGNNWPHGHSSDACNGLASVTDMIAALNGDNNSNASGTGTSNYNLVTRQNRFTLILADGTYSDNLTISGSFTASAIYYIKAMNAAGANPIIDPSTDTYRPIQVWANYSKLSGLRAQGSSSTGIYLGSTAGYVEVTYCRSNNNTYGFAAYGDYDNIFHSTSDSNQYGFYVGNGASYIDIYNCSIPSSGTSGIWVQDTVSDLTIRTNTISNTGGGGITIFSGDINNCLIKDFNRIYDSWNEGIWINGGVDSTQPLIIKNNLIYSTTGAVQGTGIALGGDYVRVYNNTFYNHRFYAVLSGGNLHHQVYNNIICVKDDAGAYGIYCSTTLPFDVCNFNCVSKLGVNGNCGYYNGAACSTMADWQAATPYDDNSFLVDPLFVNPAAFDFHLKSAEGHWNESISGWSADAVDSPCIDKGDPASDYSLELSPNGGRINQGAYGGTQYASKTSLGPMPPAPDVVSSTHPNQTLWYAGNSPAFSWSVASPPPSGIAGYSYILDQTPTTMPDNSSEGTGTSTSYSGKADGIWYFHIKAVSGTGRWGDTAHYTVQIDCAVPVAPTVSSSTHPLENTWYNNDSPAFSWNMGAAPVSGITGYSYILDQTPGTVPDNTSEGAGNSASYSGKADGTWYFHVKAQNGAGVWGGAAHFTVHIDHSVVSAPVVSSSTHPSENTWYNNNSPAFSWLVSPTPPSGIGGYSYVLDQIPGTVPDDTSEGTGNSASYSGKADGTWYFHVKASNGAGIWGNASHYTVLIDCTTPVVSLPHIQSASSHAANSSDGIAVAGGIAAGTGSLYVDYDSITEANPDCTSFVLTVAGGSGGGMNADNSDSNTPNPSAFAGLALTGATKLTCAVGHKDKTGSYAENSSTTYYVKPYTPLAPTVDTATGADNALIININPNASENSAVEYCVYSWDFGAYIAPDNTATAGNEGAAAWRTVADWANCRITGLVADTAYVFAVKSRNYYLATVYSDWSGNGSGVTGEFVAPVVTGAHIQSGAAHTAGDGYSASGGITAGTSNLFIDYDSITENHPDCTGFILAITGGSGGGTNTDNSDTNTPNPSAFAGLALTGATKLSCAVGHKDKAGNYGENSSATYYVKPYTPLAPTVDTAPGADNALIININPNASENSAVEYCVYSWDFGAYIAPDNTATAGNEGAAAWRTAADWAGCRITGLTGDTAYIFAAKSRNYYLASLYSDWSGNGSGVTGEFVAPAVAGAHIQDNAAHTAGDGYAAIGGISAGTPNLFVDYDSITENNPDCTAFILTITGGSGGGTNADNSDSNTPNPSEFTGLALTGATRVTCAVGHKDKAGNYGENSSTTYYVKPYAPLAPAVDTAPGADNVLVIDINPLASENSAVEYCVYSWDFGAYIAPDNTATGANESAAAWRTAADWAGCRITGLVVNTAYTFSVKSRNYYLAALYSDWSANGSGVTGEYIAPVVTGAHIQNNAAHAAGDGYAAGGGIAAGTPNLFVDYESITENNPDCTAFVLTIAGGAGSAVYADNSDTSLPAPHEFANLSLTGAMYVSCKVGHKDKTGNYDENASGFYYVKPYAPEAPLASGITLDNSALLLSVVKNASENDSVEYCVYNFETGYFVASDNTLTAVDESTASWRTAANWASCRITGLIEDTIYTFRVKSRNYYSALVYSDWSANGSATTNELVPPVVDGAHLQSGSAHTSGDSISPLGGIPSGTTDIYADYDSIAEVHPDCTSFTLVVTGGPGSGTIENTSDTATPAPAHFTGLALTGASKISCAVGHKDKTGNYDENASGIYYVKPYTPEAPVASKIPLDNSALLLSVVKNASENDSVEYCVYNFETGCFVATDNTLTAVDESTAAWRSISDWTSCRMTELIEDGVYTFRVKSRNYYSALVYSDWSANGSATTDELTPPVVEGAHLQTGSAHTSGDSVSPLGGIAAGTPNMFVDYDSITENNPDCTAFILTIIGGSGGGTNADNSDSNTPNPSEFTGLALTGAARITCAVGHKDKTGNYDENASGIYYVKPYTPEAPVASKIPLDNSALLLSVVKNASENDSVEYCVYNFETGSFVAADNTLTAADESTASWRSIADWTSCRITGLIEDGVYTFRVKSRNYYSALVYSDWSANGSAITDELVPPVVEGAHLQAGSAHTAGDSVSPLGGIAAGTTGVYTDYDLITEAHPDCTSFTLVVTGGVGSGAFEDVSDSTTPAPYEFIGLAVTGASKLSCAVGHKDKTGNYGENTSEIYYVKPYTPEAPALSKIPLDNSALFLSVVKHASENDSVEYCVYNFETGSFVAADNTITAVDESTAAWRSIADWTSCRITGLVGDGDYTFRVKSRNYYSALVYSDWSANGSAFTDELTPPVVDGAHLQTGSAHTAGDSVSPLGGIAAGAADIYADYDSIIEVHPDCTSFTLSVTGGVGSGSIENTSDTATPNPAHFTGLTLTGASKLSCAVGHKDKTGNYGENASGIYYVKPYTPEAPVASKIALDNAALLLSVVKNASENDSVEYCVYNFETGCFIAADNTITAVDESTAAWRTIADWASCRINGLIEDGVYTFRVKSRNYYSALVYSDWSANGSATTDELTAPIVAGAHLQSGSAHTAGDSVAPLGGVAAGAADIYADYDSIIEVHPDCTSFTLSVTGGVGSGSMENSSDTVTPDPAHFTGLALTGASKISCAVGHKDKTGNYGENTSGIYYVKPYTPEAPVASKIPLDNSALLLSVVKNASENDSVEYCVYNFETGCFIAADNTLTAADESTAAWRSIADWTSCRITGLVGDGVYTFRVKSRNYYSALVYSDWSANGSATTDELTPPVISGAHLQAGSAHTSGDSVSPLGGVAAGTTDIYADYDSITEKYPDCTSFTLSVTGGVGNGSMENTSDTATPDPAHFTGLAVDGAASIICRISHKDKTGNYGENTSEIYYVKPYTPPAPTVLTLANNDDALSFELAANPLECVSVELCAFCVESGEYLRTDGTFSASADWAVSTAWAPIVVENLNTSGIYTFRVRSRNIQENTVYSDWSDCGSAVVSNFPPAVTGAHIQGIPSHTPSDGYAAFGGISANGGDLYIDYDAMSDRDPDCTAFILTLTNESGPTVITVENTSDTTAPSPGRFSGLALTGAMKAECAVGIKDVFGHYTENASGVYFVKPWKPLKPVIRTVSGDANALSIELRQNALESVAVEHAISCVQTGLYIGTDGMPTATENAAAWKTLAAWGEVVVTTLAPDTSYTFRVKSRNYHEHTLLSDWSDSTTGRTLSAPSAPSPCYCEGQINPSNVSDFTPEFSATYNDNGAASGAEYVLEVGSDADWSHVEMWNGSDAFVPRVYDGENTATITYAGLPLDEDATYFWRIRVRSSSSIWSPWSASQTFCMMTVSSTKPQVTIIAVSATEVGADSFTTISWICTHSGVYSIENSGDGTYGSGRYLARGNVTASEAKYNNIYETQLVDNRMVKLFIIVRTPEGEEGFASLIITDDQTPPKGEILEPRSGAVLRSCDTIRGTAFDPVGVLLDVKISILDNSAARFYQAGSGFISTSEKLLPVAGLSDWTFNSAGIFSDNRSYIVKLVVTDTVGLMGNSAVSFRLDSRVPNVTVLDPSMRYFNATGSAQIDWFADLDGTYYIVAGGDGSGPGNGSLLETAPCSAGTIVSTVITPSDVPQNMETRIYIYVEPPAAPGVYGKTDVPVVYDTIMPTSTIMLPRNGSFVGFTISCISGTAFDNLSGVAKVEFCLKLGALYYDGGKITASPYYFTAMGGENLYYFDDINFVQEGDYEIISYAIDRAGNRQNPGATSLLHVVKNPLKKPKKHKGGCFIATCATTSATGVIRESDVLGEYAFSPAALNDVESLRNFRDKVLSSGALGCEVRNAYYTLAPVAAAAARDSWARELVRITLVKPLATVYRFAANTPIEAWLAAAMLMLAAGFYIFRKRGIRAG
jgi:uncharacterized protein YpmB